MMGCDFMWCAVDIRNGLPVPFRHPLKFVSGDIVEVTQIADPTEEQIQEVMDRVIAAVKKLYEEKKPEWENRPLVIH